MRPFGVLRRLGTRRRFSDSDYAPHIDRETAMQTILLAAHAIGLGSGPVTSFAKAALSVVLDLPDNLTPEIIVCLGHRSDETNSPCEPGKSSAGRPSLTGIGAPDGMVSPRAHNRGSRRISVTNRNGGASRVESMRQWAGEYC